MAVYTITTEAERPLNDVTYTNETHLLQLKTASKVAELTHLSISFEGVTAADKPMLVELRRSNQAHGGYVVSGCAFDEEFDGDAINSETTGLVLASGITTPGNRLRMWEVHAQGGLLDIEFPEGRTPKIKPNSAINLVVTLAEAPTTAVRGVGDMTWRE